MRSITLWACLPFLCLVSTSWADDANKATAKTHQIPYRLTNTKHVLVRAKINGKGPFNFIIDTGAPALFVSTATCKKLGIEPDKKGWGVFDRFELEGGAVVEKARGRIEDPFQLEGMNGLGLAGVELHGVIGYNILAKFKMEFDFTKDKMTWTLLNFEPPPPLGLDGKGQSGVDAMAAFMKIAVALLGNRPKPEVKQRGFVGVELQDGKEGPTVQAVLPKSAAATAGLQKGDRIVKFQGQSIKTVADVQKQADSVAAGESAQLTILRGEETRQITIRTGEGL